MKLSKSQKDTILDEMKKKHFNHKQSNGVDIYFNKAINEGIEVKGTDVINPFVMLELERMYGYDQVGNETRAAVSIIEQILMEQAPEPAEKEQAIPKQEVEEPKNEIVPQDQLYGIIPVCLTDALMNKHPGSIPCLIGLQETPEAYLMERKGPAGKMITYVEGNVMKRQANFAFLFNWDHEVTETWDDEFEMSAEVRCTFRFTEGHTVVKTEVGGADKKFSKTLKDKDGNARQIMIADTRKAAITDGVKCCLRDLGMNDDVFSGRRKKAKKGAV